MAKMGTNTGFPGKIGVCRCKQTFLMKKVVSKTIKTRAHPRSLARTRETRGRVARGEVLKARRVSGSDLGPKSAFFRGNLCFGILT